MPELKRIFSGPSPVQPAKRMCYGLQHVVVLTAVRGVDIMPAMDEEARFCRRCGAELGSGSRFCPSCGAPVEEPADTDAKRRQGKLAVILGLLVGAAAALIVLMYAGRGGQKVTGANNASPNGPEVLKARPPVNNGPPIVGLPPINRPPAPPDPYRDAVAAYLQKVKKIEVARKEVVSDLVPAMMVIASARMGQGLMDLYRDLFPEEFENKPEQQPSLAQQSWQTITGYMEKLRALYAQLQAIKPPPTAERFHAAYSWAFGAYIGAMLEVRSNLEKGMSGDPQQALQALNASRQSLRERTRGALERADAELGQLCSRHDLRREFAVTDSSEAPLTGADVPGM
ncbi:MAG: zinc-ribbon domain-containing protein [Armatimonadota bacterium]